MTRLGKIARLPRRVREDLNDQLLEGVSGAEVVEWLNGFEEWRRHEEAREWLSALVEEGEELEEAAGEGLL